MITVYWNMNGLTKFSLAEVVQLGNDLENQVNKPMLLSLNVISMFMMTLLYFRASKLVPYTTLVFYVTSIDRAHFNTTDLAKLNITLNETADTKKAYDEALSLTLSQQKPSDGKSLTGIMDDFDTMDRNYKLEIKNRQATKGEYSGWPASTLKSLGSKKSNKDYLPFQNNKSMVESGDDEDEEGDD